jgi:hypothetical protein
MRAMSIVVYHLSLDGQPGCAKFTDLELTQDFFPYTSLKAGLKSTIEFFRKDENV